MIGRDGWKLLGMCLKLGYVVLAVWLFVAIFDFVT